MPSQEVSTNNHGREDVPQRNEIVVDEEGSQNISEAVEEPPTKRSKIDKIPKTVVLEALDGLREADERLLSLYEETLQMKDDEINLLRKQITDYARERREMLKYIDKAKSTIKTSVPKHNPNGAPKVSTPRALLDEKINELEKEFKVDDKLRDDIDDIVMHGCSQAKTLALLRRMRTRK